MSNSTMRRPKTWKDYGARIAVYTILSVAGIVVLVPFIIAFFGSFKTAEDVFTYPPRLLPRDPAVVTVDGKQLPVFQVPVGSGTQNLARAEQGVSVREFRGIDDSSVVVLAPKSSATEVPGKTTTVDGQQVPVYTVTVDGQPVEVYNARSRIVNAYVDPNNPNAPPVYAPASDTVPAEQLGWHAENYSKVLQLNSFHRSLTNTVLVTVLVVVGQVVTSIMGGYAFSRLRFRGRDQLFLFYLGSIMIPFVVLMIPLYRLMVTIGWVNNLVSLIIPFVFTAYGTFLMRQFFVSIPRELEEAAIIDGAGRWRILWGVLVPLSIPAIATLATFSFLYAWNSFIWPLIVIDSGNLDNSVLSLTLSVLGGRAADAPNLILAGVMLAMLPPVTVFLLAQRSFVENAASSGLKG